MKTIVGIFLAGIIVMFAILSLSKTLGVGTDVVNTLEVSIGGDKMLHFWGAGIISIMLCYLLSYCPNRIAFWVMCLLVIEEGSQVFFPNRHFNLDDIGAGCAGVLAFVFVFKLFSNNGR